LPKFHGQKSIFDSHCTFTAIKSRVKNANVDSVSYPARHARAVFTAIRRRLLVLFFTLMVLWYTYTRLFTPNWITVILSTINSPSISLKIIIPSLANSELYR